MCSRTGLCGRFHLFGTLDHSELYILVTVFVTSTLDCIVSLLDV